MKEHLELITVDAMEAFKKTAFSSFASSSGRYGRVELGVDAYGYYVVRHTVQSEKLFTYKTAEEAIEKYRDIIL